MNDHPHALGPHTGTYAPPTDFPAKPTAPLPIDTTPPPLALPCPFCGGEPKADGETIEHPANCWAALVWRHMRGYCPSEEQWRAAWNRRSPAPSADGAVRVPLPAIAQIQGAYQRAPQGAWTSAALQARGADTGARLSCAGRPLARFDVDDMAASDFCAFVHEAWPAIRAALSAAPSPAPQQGGAQEALRKLLVACGPVLRHLRAMNSSDAPKFTNAIAEARAALKETGHAR